MVRQISRNLTHVRLLSTAVCEEGGGGGGVRGKGGRDYRGTEFVTRLFINIYNIKLDAEALLTTHASVHEHNPTTVDIEGFHGEDGNRGGRKLDYRTFVRRALIKTVRRNRVPEVLEEDYRQPLLGR